MISNVFELRCPLGGATVRSVDSGVKVQIDGQHYVPDRVEPMSVSDDAKTEFICHFSKVGLSLRLVVEKTESLLSLCGILQNLTDKAVSIDQLWFGECLVDLGGTSEEYRVYYNSGCQESSGTCRFSAIKNADGTARALTDPDDAVAKDKGLFASTCIQPDCVRSQYVTAIYSKDGESAICLGDTSFHRAETVFFVKPGPVDTAVMVSPVILYNGMVLEPGEELAVEEIEVYGNKSPLIALEMYVDQVAKKKELNLKPIESIVAFWNAWYAFSNEEMEAGAEAKAVEYQRDHLLGYNIRLGCPGVVWQREEAFFESRTHPYLGATIAELTGRMAAKFPEFHMCGGLFWGSASECSDFFSLHPEAILHDKQGRLCRRGSESWGTWGTCFSPCYWVDFSHPAAREFFNAHLLSLKAQADIKTFKIDFMGDTGEWKGTWAYLREDDNPFLGSDPYDAHLNRPFETDRVIPQTIRGTLGSSVVIHSYTAFFMRYLGLIDVVRTAVDSGRVEHAGVLYAVNWGHLRAAIKNLAANYMFHGKWWWSDADALCVGTKVIPERTEEFRIRSMIKFIVGGPVTLGDKIEQMASEQFRYYTINMPSTGHAARPLDLFEKDIPEIFHLPKSRTGYDHDMLTLFNLTDEARDYELSLLDLGIEGKCLGFEFWTRELVRIENGVLKVTLPPLTGRHYALHQDKGTPMVLGTDFHLSMGARELSDICWDAEAMTLSGVLHRPAVETGRIYLHVPEGIELNSAIGGKMVQENGLVVLEMESATAPVSWRVEFR